MEVGGEEVTLPTVEDPPTVDYSAIRRYLESVYRAQQEEQTKKVKVSVKSGVFYKNPEFPCCYLHFWKCSDFPPSNR